MTTFKATIVARLPNYGDTKLTLQCENTKYDVFECLLGRQVDVMIVPSSHSPRQGQVHIDHLADLIRTRSSATGALFVDDLIKAVTDDVATRYEAIIAQRISDAVEQMKPKLLLEAKEAGEQELKHSQAVSIRAQQLEVKQQREGVQELIRALEHSVEALDNLDEELGDSLMDLGNADCPHEEYDEGTCTVCGHYDAAQDDS